MNHTDDKLTNHDYDGIKEYDNPLPSWWTITFLGTIIFSFIYWIHYEIAGGPNLDQELQAALQKIERTQAAAPAQSTTADEFLTIENDNTRMSAAAANYTAKCAVCHGKELGGLIGPNLTDNFWIHGQGTNADIADVIRTGIPEKGMPPWKDLLKESEIAELAVYISKHKGSSPPNAKPAEGNEVQSQ